MEDLKEARKELEAALMILGTLSVSGEAVEVMAAVRAKLKRVMAMLEAGKEEAHG